MPKKQNKELNVEVFINRPFGPRVLTADIPQKWVDAFNVHCDKIIKSKKRKERDASGYLVGHVSEELTCDLNDDALAPFGHFISNATSAFFREFNQEQNVKNPPQLESVHVNRAWFVRSYKDDYNPGHIHTNAHLSCVLYLKVPDSIGDTNYKNKKEHYTTEGYIDFINGGTDILTAGKWLQKPKVGKVYLFPSNLLHTVYPFYGKGERRTFSCNLECKFND
jgi:uncharacterized protein (TIGR02466 family)